MAQTSTTDKQQKTRSLVAGGGKLCIQKGGRFTACTNFTIDVMFAVESPAEGPAVTGFVYRIKTMLSEKDTETRSVDICIRMCYACYNIVYVA